MPRQCFSFATEALATEVAHDGSGEIGTVRVLRDADGSHFSFIDLTEIPPGHSVGIHTHGPDDEEAYVIICGRGRMHVDGEEFEVGPGDVIVNTPGGTHGLANIGTEPLRMVVLDVARS
jgi:mannose-6-phosphate isomerase-like protein (cupin superfamily)